MLWSPQIPRICAFADVTFRFPKVPKDTLKATLDQYAVRVGQKESEKKWVWR
jgi:hypothetical protein